MTGWHFIVQGEERMRERREEEAYQRMLKADEGQKRATIEPQRGQLYIDLQSADSELLDRLQAAYQGRPEERIIQDVKDERAREAETRQQLISTIRGEYDRIAQGLKDTPVSELEQMVERLKKEGM